MAAAVVVLFTALLGTVCFACFAWGTIRHFRWEGRAPSGAWAVSLLSWAGYFLFLFRLWQFPQVRLWPVVWALCAAALAVWSWTIAMTRRTPPTLAFAGDAPRFLFATGPYSWVRHPFYTSYLLFWMATGLSSPGAWGWFPFVVLGAIYLYAARHEEAKFAGSSLADQYSDYARRTGMFLPWPFLRTSLPDM